MSDQPVTTIIVSLSSQDVPSGSIKIADLPAGTRIVNHRGVLVVVEPGKPPYTMPGKCVVSPDFTYSISIAKGGQG